MAVMHLAQDPEADRLLGESGLALLIGMVLDQQIPLERAFRAPLELSERLMGPLDASSIADLEPEVLEKAFSKPPALHRFPSSMAARVQTLCGIVRERYPGGAEEIWTSASSGAELLSRIKELPGFGQQKAQIFVALVGKRLGVRPPGWREAAGRFGEEGSFASVADIDGPETLAEVRRRKAEAKAAARADAAVRTGTQTEGSSL